MDPSLERKVVGGHPRQRAIVDFDRPNLGARTAENSVKCEEGPAGRKARLAPTDRAEEWLEGV
jgi:hypothetical protein